MTLYYDRVLLRAGATPGTYDGNGSLLFGREDACLSDQMPLSQGLIDLKQPDFTLFDIIDFACFIPFPENKFSFGEMFFHHVGNEPFKRVVQF